MGRYTVKRADSAIFKKNRYRKSNRLEKNADVNTEYRHRLEVPTPTYH